MAWLILPIAPILFTKVIADDPLETLPARLDRNAWKLLLSDAEGPSAVQSSEPAGIPRRKNRDYVRRLLRRQRGVDHGSPGVNQSLTERVQIPGSLLVGQIIWDRFHVVFNNSALASYTTTKFYMDIAKLPSREQWVFAAAYSLILSCGAIKLTFEVVASERPVSWQTAWAFVLDFVRLMIHISRSVALASYNVVVITAFVTYLVAFYIFEHPAQQPHLITAPRI